MRTPRGKPLEGRFFVVPKTPKSPKVLYLQISFYWLQGWRCVSCHFITFIHLLIRLRSDGKRSGKKTADWEPWSRVLPQEVGRVYEMIIGIIGDRRLQLRASEGRPEYFVL